jgi:hypothetical protein
MELLFIVKVKGTVVPVIKYHVMKVHGKWKYTPPFLTSALDREGKWSASCSGRLARGDRIHITHFIGGWVDLRDSLGAVESRKVSCC